MENTQLEIPTEIRTYLVSLLTASGIASSDPVQQETLVQELFLKLDDYIIDRVIEYMPIEKLDGFTDLMKKDPSKEAVEQYIQTHVPNAQDIFTVAFADFRGVYLKAVSDAKQAPPA